MHPNCVFKNEIVLYENRESLIKGKDSKRSELINHAISLFKVMPSSPKDPFLEEHNPAVLDQPMLTLEVKITCQILDTKIKL
jgi:hypothetical protein